MQRISIGIMALSLLVGCIDPKTFATAPVKVKSPKGVVTCQLYTKEEVLWDRAEAMPKSMTVAEADKVCIAEGHKQRGY